MTAQQNTFKLALITWCDPISQSNWVSIDHIQSLTPYKCLKSVGWITHETEEHIELSSNIRDDAYSHNTTLMKSCIIDMQIIEQ